MRVYVGTESRANNDVNSLDRTILWQGDQGSKEKIYNFLKKKKQLEQTDKSKTVTAEQLKCNKVKHSFYIEDPNLTLKFLALTLKLEHKFPY